MMENTATEHARQYWQRLLAGSPHLPAHFAQVVAQDPTHELYPLRSWGRLALHSWTQLAYTISQNAVTAQASTTLLAILTLWSQCEKSFVVTDEQLNAWRMQHLMDSQSTALSAQMAEYLPHASVYVATPDFFHEALQAPVKGFFMARLMDASSQTKELHLLLDLGGDQVTQYQSDATAPYLLSDVATKNPLPLPGDLGMVPVLLPLVNEVTTLEDAIQEGRNKALRRLKAREAQALYDELQAIDEATYVAEMVALLTPVVLRINTLLASCEPLLEEASLEAICAS